MFRPLVTGAVGTTVLDAARGFDGNITQPRTQTALQRHRVLPPPRRLALGAGEAGGRPGGNRPDLRRGDPPPGRASRRGVLPRGDRQRASARHRGAQSRHGARPRGLRAGAARGRPGQPAQPRALVPGARHRRGTDPGVRARRAAGPGGSRHRHLRRRSRSTRPATRRSRSRPRFRPTRTRGWPSRPDVRLLDGRGAGRRSRGARRPGKSWLPTASVGVQPAVRHARPASSSPRTPGARSSSSRSRSTTARSAPRRRLRIAEREIAQLRLEAVKVQARSEVRFAQEAVDAQRADRDHDAARRRRTRARRSASPRSPTGPARPPTSRSCRPSRRPATPRSWPRSPRTGCARPALDLLVALGQFP